MAGLSAGFWGLACEPGNTYSQMVESTFRITGAALDHKAPANGGRVSVSVMYGDSEFVIANLIPGKAEHQLLDLTFNEGEELTFIVHGNSTVHLSGNHIQDIDYDEDDDEDDDDADMFDEDGNPIDFGDDDDDDDDDDDEDGEGDAADDEIMALLEANLKRKALANGSKTTKKPKIVEIEGDEEAEVEGAEDDDEEEDDGEDDGDDDDEEEDVEEEPAQKPKAEKQQPKQATKKPEPKAGKDIQKPEKKPEQKGAQQEQKKEKDAKEKDAKVKTLPSGLVIEDVVVGNGTRAKNGKKVQMRYIGRLTNGKVFDSNTSGGKPFTFKLGAGEVIKGWDLGIQGMNVGGSRKLTIPANLAYGSKGAPPDIPGNATLVFEVKLLNVL